MDLDAVQVEREHVHQVYDEIALHFSATRYKPWPVIEKFVNNLKDASVGIDVGCGNGKNMLLRSKDIVIFGFDLSLELLKICNSQSFECIQGTMLKLPFREASQDFVICIAALHHLATSERRLRALEEIGHALKGGGEALIYVWALEQPSNSSLYRHKLEILTRDGQDVLVPWNTTRKDDNTGAPITSTQLRFYHLFRQGELEELLLKVGLFEIHYNGYDRDNWYVCAKRKIPNA